MLMSQPLVPVLNMTNSELRSSGVLYNVVSYRRFGTTYRTHRQGSSSPKKVLTLEGGTDRLSSNVGSNQGCQHPRKAKTSHRSGGLKSGKINLVHILLSYFFIIRFNITYPWSRNSVVSVATSDVLGGPGFSSWP
jgi:hypothetical protein